MRFKNFEKKYYKIVCLEEYLNKHSFFTTRFEPWRESIQKPISQRVATVNEEMIQFLGVDNLVYGGGIKDVKASTDPEAIQFAQAALNDMPVEIQKYLEDHFYGFVLIQGVSYTGFAPKIVPFEGDHLKLGGIIIINIDNIRSPETGMLRSLSEWLSFREKTALQAFDEKQGKDHFDISLYFDGKTDVTAKDFFKWFLLHEMAHVIAAVEPEIHPDFKYKSKNVPYSEFEKINPTEPLKAFPFLDHSFVKTLVVNQKGEKEVVLTRRIEARSNKILNAKPVKFYVSDYQKKFTNDEAVVLFTDMQNSCFTSLYSLVDYTEDFAETLTHYFLHQEGYGNFVTTFSDQKSNQELVRFVSQLLRSPECKAKIDELKMILN